MEAGDQASGGQHTYRSETVKLVKLDGIKVADHLGAYAHSVRGRDASVGVYSVAGMVRGHGHEGHTVLH